MSDHQQAGYLDRRAAERILDGAYDHARLHTLLTAAAAPGRPEELAGEDAAVAAFMAAPRPAPRSRTAALRRFLTIKALAVVGGSLILTGGAAYATITGQFPGSDPAPSQSPISRDPKGTDSEENPATKPSSPAPSTTPSAPSPHGKEKERGKPSGAPGRPKKTSDTKPNPPRHTPTPPRGPGDNNGNAPAKTDAGSGNSTTSEGGLGGGPPPSTYPDTGTPPSTGTESGESRGN
ncbi:hypothetical protein E1264_13765 [Actinomadura sp. KC216]|uniref:hypothetical protein n=1 Tax=Actinomadura sp. KC216 TaxID=2530370 RepID=UPI001049EA6E|nr:hypothetical protein [Actinomadura sp. KC216]TDB87710.1 hypothetical protein E1264_13765 [Actinomadura sp. KC216]